MRLLIAVCTLFFLAGNLQILQAQNTQLKKEIGKIIRYEAEIDFSRVPGVLVGVIDGDSTYTCSFGVKMDPDSIYEMGSVTKPVIAWLVDQALDSLGWTREVSVCMFLPDSICHGVWSSLTVDQVLSHRSGLSRLPTGMGETMAAVRDPYIEYDVRRLSQDLATIIPDPGKYSYSDLAYAMLYWLFEKVGGLGSFARERLIKPLGLSHTGWDFPDDMIAQGHGLDGSLRSPWHVNAMATAMGLKSSMHDMLDLVRSIAPPVMLQKSGSPYSLNREGAVVDKAGAYTIMDGWFLIKSGCGLVYYHTGRTGGHQVSIALMTEKRKGVVVISNGALGSNELCMLVLNMVNRAK